MAVEATPRYETLRRTKRIIRVLAPISSSTLLVAGLSLFIGQTAKLDQPGFALSERLIFGAIGLGYLFGFGLTGFACLFLLRAGADLIDVWIDTAVASEKTADLIERQLVPAFQRACQLLERLTEVGAAGSATKSGSVPAAEAQTRGAETRRK